MLTAQSHHDVVTDQDVQPREESRRGLRRRRSSVSAVRAMGWTPGAAHGAKLAKFLLLGVLACGPLALAGLDLSGGAHPTASASVIAAPSSDAGATLAVGNFAAEFVTAWLTTPSGQESSLDFYVSGASGLQLPRTPATVANVAVADVEQAGLYRPRQASAPASAAQDPTAPTAAAAAPQLQRAWRVTVAADVSQPGPNNTTLMVRRYFSVPLAQQVTDPAAPATNTTATTSAPSPSPDDAGGDQLRLRALLWPQPVAGPASGGGMDTDYDQQVSANGVLASSVGEFLTAYLAGQGDVDRYLTPGYELRPVTPAAYTAVSVQQVLAGRDDPVEDTPHDGQRAQVLVTAGLTTLTAEQASTQYALQLTARAGRWEVSALQDLPVLAATAVTNTAAPVAPTRATQPAAPTSTGTQSSSSSPTQP